MSFEHQPKRGFIPHMGENGNDHSTPLESEVNRALNLLPLGEHIRAMVPLNEIAFEIVQKSPNVDRIKAAKYQLKKIYGAEMAHDLIAIVESGVPHTTQPSAA